MYFSIDTPKKLITIYQGSSLKTFYTSILIINELYKDDWNIYIGEIKNVEFLDKPIDIVFDQLPGAKSKGKQIWWNIPGLNIQFIGNNGGQVYLISINEPDQEYKSVKKINK